MSSSCSDDNDDQPKFYSQSRAGPSKESSGKSYDDDYDDDEGFRRFREEDIIDIDDAITMLLASLRFEQNRSCIPTDKDDDDLRRLHEKIFSIIARETDDHRRRRLKKALPASNCVREQVFYLRRGPTTPSPSYFHRLSAALETIVKDSFEEDYRKVATVLGLVEALAECLILEVGSFGVPRINHNEHRTIRKLIANALTNLTFGQIHSKRRLCSYDGFVRCVVRIIVEAPNVTQVYAGLVRNLSWMADAEMSEALQPTVNALAMAAVHANKNRDDGCVKATLSALWNLASHSVENKRTICETPNCLAVLAGLLTTDSRQTAIVDSATGILKYVLHYLANTSNHIELRGVLLTRLVSLLGSSSFTVVTNTLGAISNLISKDPHLQNALRCDMNAVQQLNILRNSNREDIRVAVKNVLNAINQPTMTSRYGDMSCSMGGMFGDSNAASSMIHSHHTYHSSSTASPRLLPLRATRASPGHMHFMGMDQRSCSLPRQFNGNPSGLVHSYNDQYNTEKNENDHSNDDVNIIEAQSETAMGTRSNSARSLGSADPGSVMNTGGWNSTIDTAANSSRALSPVSFSEIPASPTMCANQQVFNTIDDQQQTPVFPQNNLSGFKHPNDDFGSRSNTMTRGSECADEFLTTPTFANLEEYAMVGKKSEDLLERSIQEEMPPKASPILNGFFSPPLSSKSAQKNDGDKLLMECILSEMPGQSSKNEEADRRDDFKSSSHEPSDRGEVVQHEIIREGSRLMRVESLESRASSDDSFEPATNEVCCTNDNNIDTSIPDDCYDDDEEEDFYDDDDEDLDATHFEDGTNNMTIDCSIISSGSGTSSKASKNSGALATSTPKGSTTSIQNARSATRVPIKSAGAERKTRLPVPRTNGTIAEKIRKAQIPMTRPRLPPKPEMMKCAKDLCSVVEEKKDDTIYVNAPPKGDEQIYVNTSKKENEKQEVVEKPSRISTKSVIVPPYNYQKPFVTRSNGQMSNDNSSVQSNPKQMLVTTV